MDMSRLTPEQQRTASEIKNDKERQAYLNGVMEGLKSTEGIKEENKKETKRKEPGQFKSYLNAFTSKMKSLSQGHAIKEANKVLEMVKNSADENVKAQVAEVENKIEKLKEGKAELDKGVSDSMHRISEIKAAKSKAKEIKKAERAKTLEAKAKLKEEKKEGRFAKIKTKMALASVERHEKKMKKLQNELNDAKNFKNSEEYKSEVAETRAEYKEAAIALDSKKSSQIQAVKNKISNLENAILNINSETKKSQVNFEKDRVELEKQITAVKNEIKKLDKKIKNSKPKTRRDLKPVKKDLKVREEKQKAMEKLMGQLKALKAARNEEKVDLLQDLTLKQNDLEAAKRELTKLENEFKTSEDKMVIDEAAEIRNIDKAYEKLIEEINKDIDDRQVKLDEAAKRKDRSLATLLNKVLKVK